MVLLLGNPLLPLSKYRKARIRSDLPHKRTAPSDLGTCFAQNSASSLDHTGGSLVELSARDSLPQDEFAFCPHPLEITNRNLQLISSCPSPLSTNKYFDRSEKIGQREEDMTFNIKLSSTRSRKIRSSKRHP